MMSKIVERSGSAEIVLMLLFTWVVPAICDPTSQLTFSIDCGTTENYTDENGITWTSDAGFIATGQNAQNLTVTKNVAENFFNTEQSQSLRFFDQGRGRDCYVLPVESEFIYLVRPTFYYGDWNSPENYTSFDVYLNANKFLNFEFNATQESYYQILTFEALVYPSGATALDVCLVRKAGTPFISSLELRQLDRGMYSSTVAINKYLGTWQRLNYGVNVSDYIYLRYPDDIYDRIWSTAQDIGFLPQDYGINVSNKSNIPVSNSLTPERPPVKVMEDYLTYPNSSYLTITSQSEYPFGPIAAYSYFQEVDESANASHVRGMDFYFNNFPLETFNTSNEPSEISSCLLYITDTMLNITLNQSSSSKLKPILNALEIYLVYDWNAAKTAIEDVKSIDTIKGLFNLNDWYGDPCLPVPYDWLDCDIPYTEASTATNNQTNVQGMVNTTAYVTSISLTNIAIVQTFPEEVLLFSHLTSLSLKNTSLESIPSSLSSGMENLISLDVSNNKISGRVVDFVQNITAASNATSLQVLYAENNLLEGEFLLDEFYSQFPELEEAYFDTNKNISGILNLTSLQTALITGSGNNTAKYTGKAAIVPPAGTGSTLPLISLTNNQITGITPSLDTLSDDISNFLRTRNSFNDLNGVLLGGNPWCEQTQFDQQPLSQQYLCRSSSSSALPGITNLSSKGTNVGAIVGGVVGGVAFLFFLICLLVIWKLHKRTSSLNEIQEALARQKVQPPFYSYAALRAATHDFSPANKLGQGSFGAVYKGAVLDTTDGTQELVAVKKLYSSKQALSEFLNEAVLITGIKHRNLVQLKGCCIYKEDERMLVYEYAENGNLAEALLGAQGNDKPEEQQTRLDWRQRLNICVGIARGLSYLHEELQPRIIHRDIKPSNILLDANYNAKIADFGLARSILEGQTQADFTQVAGTKGYFSPEYATQGQLTEKADVFSFGVVLLEIVSGRKWRDDRLPPEKQFLQAWARHLKNEGKLLDLLDPKVRKSAHDDEVIRVISLAFLCLEFDPLKRPTMSETVTMLQGITSVTLYKADSDTSSTFPSPIGQGVYNYMKLPTSLDDLSEKLVVDSFETSASSSTTPNTGIEFSRLAAR